MLFVERHEEIIKNAKPRTVWEMTIKSAGFGLIIFVLTSVYRYTETETYNITEASAAFADTAMVLIGLSLALSGLCYFWDFLDSKIIYRKYLGLVGFAFGAVHAIVSLVFYLVVSYDGAHYDLFNVWDVFSIPVSNVVAFLFGLTALIIFSLMAAISTKHSAMSIGGKRWRELLRWAGYAAFISVALHFFIKASHEWVHWIEQPDQLPPFNLILFVTMIAVLILRFALWISERRKRREKEKDAGSA